ncbi:thioredoxin-like protein Dim1 isoform X3 [Rhipicephalus microplus]|uniref:thioredoxin-like protein Dim1 isoform X3 n=1 Tax=Rhipicephalus microplus TaxID=6941 RepID=UPI003F6AFB98
MDSPAQQLARACASADLPSPVELVDPPAHLTSSFPQLHARSAEIAALLALCLVPCCSLWKSNTPPPLDMDNGKLFCLPTAVFLCAAGCCDIRWVSSHVVHAAAPAQWLASRPGHPVGGGPGGGHPLWPRLGPHLHEDGRGALLHCREGTKLLRVEPCWPFVMMRHDDGEQACSRTHSLSAVMAQNMQDTAQVYIAQFQQINIVVKNFAALYLVDISEVPDFNKMYELYDPCTVMFFFRNKHIMIDLGTGNNNKINWALEDKQEMIDIIETVYRGARKGRGLVVSPKDYSTKYRY